MLHYFVFFFFTLCASGVEYGIDRLHEKPFQELLRNKRIAILTHAAAVNRHGKHLLDLVYPEYNILKLFVPEHGLRSLEDDFGNDGVDEVTGLPVISLYKRQVRSPSEEELSDIDTIVIDLQDVGLRYYTYFSTIAQVIKSAAENNKKVILLDRPNLLGRNIEGATLDSIFSEHFISFHTIPTRHGMTLGELSRLLVFEKKWQVDLKVIAVKGWDNKEVISKLDRPWVPPSPALPEARQVYYYAYFGTLEHYNLAVGRGKTNELAFKVLGAPWITPKEAITLADNLNDLGLKGITFAPFSWKVTRALYDGQFANGVKIEIKQFYERTDEVTYKVAQVLHRILGTQLSSTSFLLRSLGQDSILNAIQTQKPWSNLELIIKESNHLFNSRRLPFLLP